MSKTDRVTRYQTALKKVEEPVVDPKTVDIKDATVIPKNGLNLRREPKKDAEVIRVLKEGEKVTVSHEYGEWSMATTMDDQTVGYVMTKFLKF